MSTPEWLQPVWSTLLRLLLSGVLLTSGIAKITDLPASVRAVRAFQILPEVITPLAGYALPVIELILAVLLLAGLLTGYAATGTALLMAGFIAGIVSAWARGLSIDCGCFGGGGEIAPGQTTYPQDILRDLGLLVAALWLAWQPRSRLALDNVLGLAPPGRPAGTRS